MSTLRVPFFSSLAPSEPKPEEKIQSEFKKLKTTIEKLSSIDPEKEQKFISESARDFSDSAKIIHDIGFMIGGKSGAKAIQFASGLSEIGTSLTVFGITSAPLTVLSYAGGVTGIMVGVFQIASAFWGDDDEGPSSFQMIIEALYHLSQMIEKGFTQILRNQAYHSLQISQLSTQISRVENLMRVSTKENYLQNYLTLTIRLKNHLSGRGIRARSEEIIKDLGDLQSWIISEGHAYKATVNGSVLVSDVSSNVSFHVGILSHADFDPVSMIGYLAPLLEHCVSHCLTTPMKRRLPNLHIFLEGSVLYKEMIEQFHPEGDIAPIMTDLADQWKMVVKYLQELGGNNAIWNSLCRQIQGFVRQAIQYLVFLEHGGKFNAEEGMVGRLLPEGVEKTHLISILDQLEMRRLLMIKWWEILGKSERLKERIAQLPSKVSILKTLRSSLQEANTKLSEAANRGDVKGVRSALGSGADPAQIRYPIMQLPGEAKQSEILKRKNSFEIFDLLIQYSSNYSPLDLVHRIMSTPQDSPLKSIVKFGSYAHFMLVCAQGLDTSESTQHYHCGFRCSYQSRDFEFIGSAISHRILLAISRDINNKDGVLNKADLRHGYQFYRAAQANNREKMDSLLDEKPIKPHIIIWLTALLGDIYPLEALQARGIEFSSEDTIRGIAFDKTHFYPMQLAAELNHDEAIRVIGDIGYNLPANLIEPLSGKPLVAFAVEQEFKNTAVELWIHGFHHPSQPRSYKFRGKWKEDYSVREHSLVTKCQSYSDYFLKSLRRMQARNALDEETITMIRSANYAGASKRILHVLISRGFSEERAVAYLRGFARHDYIGVVVAKINSDNEILNGMLRKHLPRIISSYQSRNIFFDIIDFSDALLKNIKSLSITDTITDELMIDLIQKSIKKSLDLTLPKEILINIETELWEIVALDIVKLDPSQNKKLFSYLIVNCEDSQRENEAFNELIAALKKLINKDQDIRIENKSAISSQLKLFSIPTSVEDKESKRTVSPVLPPPAKKSTSLSSNYSVTS